MVVRRWAAVGGLLAVLAVSSHASTITDPHMGVEDDSSSNPLNVGGTFAPNNGGGVFKYYNNTGQAIINFLLFGTYMASDLNLTSTELNGIFACNDASTPGFPNPFFLFCSISYQNTSGLLSIFFYGTLPPPPGGGGGGPDEGIPPLPAGCDSSNADTGPCLGTGHFLITLNDGFLPTGSSGGWSQANNPVLFPNGDPIFTIDAINYNPLSAPEPGSALLAGGALIAAIGLFRLWGRLSCQPALHGFRPCPAIPGPPRTPPPSGEVA